MILDTLATTSPFTPREYTLGELMLGLFAVLLLMIIAIGLAMAEPPEKPPVGEDPL